MKCQKESITCNGKVKEYSFGPYDVCLCDWHRVALYPERGLILKVPQPLYYKKGQTLWSVYFDIETGKCELWEYVVRTIRRPWVYAIIKQNGVTWVKKSRKIGDFGWAYPIPSWYRQRTKYGSKFNDLFTTKRQAWMAVIKKLKDKNAVKDYGADIVNRALTTSKRNVTIIDNKNKRGKAK